MKKNPKDNIKRSMKPRSDSFEKKNKQNKP